MHISCENSFGLEFALMIRGGGYGEEAQSDGDGKNYDSTEDRLVDVLGEAMTSDVENRRRPQANHEGEDRENAVGGEKFRRYVDSQQ